MDGLLGGYSLVAPLDLLRFGLAYLVTVVMPGYAVATLVRPCGSRLERAALAIPCSYSLVAVSGLITAVLGLGYGLPTYALLAAPLTTAAAYLAWNRHAQRRRTQGMGRAAGKGIVAAGEQPKPKPWSWELVAVGVALVQVAVLLSVFAGYPAPANGDDVRHILWTDHVALAHTFPLALLSPSGSATGGFYPPVFHVLTAMILQIAPMSTIHAVFYSVVATTVALPLGLYVLVERVTGNARIGALAAIASLTFDPLPLYLTTQAYYTLVASQTFVPVLALALLDALGHSKRRAAVLACLLGIGLFYTHPTEFLTVALLVLAIVPGQLRRVAGWTLAAVAGVAIAAVWGLAALPALAAVRHTMVFGAQVEIASKRDFVPSAAFQVGPVLGNYVQAVFGRNAGYALLLLVVVGIISCLIRRRLLGLVAAQLLLSALFLDVTSANLLQRFYVLAFPWALWERLAVTHYWFSLPLAAIGLEAVLVRVLPALRARSMPFVALAAAPAILVAIVLPFGVTTARIAVFVHAHVMLAPADFGSIAWLSRHAVPGSVVVNDSNLTTQMIYDSPTDAGLWLPVLGGPQPLFWTYETGPGPLDQRIDLARHIADVPLPPRAAAFAARYHVRYVLYSAGLRVTATRHLDLGRLLRDPGLRLVYSSAPSCPATQPYNQDRAGRVTDRTANCPLTASYVFALNQRAIATTGARGPNIRVASVVR